MLTAAKAMLLAGDVYKAGEEISPAKWASLTTRTRKALTRTRRVRSTDLAVVVADTPPRTTSVPRTADGPTPKRGRPRKKA